MRRTTLGEINRTITTTEFERSLANRRHPGFAGKTEHVGRLRENKASDLEASDIDAILMTHMYSGSWIHGRRWKSRLQGRRVGRARKRSCILARRRRNGTRLVRRLRGLPADPSGARRLLGPNPHSESDDAPRAGHRCHDQPDDLWPAIAIPERVGHA